MNTYNKEQQEIKQWVVKKATVTNPYKKYWSASVTLGGMDINGEGDTIEKAYQMLTAFIAASKYYSKELFKIINNGQQSSSAI